MDEVFAKATGLRFFIHLKKHGGTKYSAREVRDHLAHNRFVRTTDVKFYYASIDHLMLLDQLVRQAIVRMGREGSGCFNDTT